MRRSLSHFLFIATVVATCVDAQAAPKSAHIGFLRAEAPEPVFESFREGMRDLGYVEGRNLIIEQRWAHGNYNALPRLAQELVDLKVDVIFASCTPCTQAVLRATQTIPIVTVSGDPLGMGFVASLSRPGGNVTGLTLTLEEITLKRLELLKEVAPGVLRVAVLYIGQNPIWDRIIDGMKRVAPALGLEIEPVKAAGPSQIEEALDAVMGRRADALYVFEDPVLRDNSAQIIAFAAKRRIPSIYGGTDFVRNGGLLSYGASFDDLFRKAATYVVQILAGAKPGELPMQQPTKYELAVNLKTAKALGLRVPESILLRATEVIR
jgi:putative ABC transport system substrate-binding protein